MFLFQWTGGYASGLDAFEGEAIPHAAPAFIEQRAEADAHRHLDQTDRLQRSLDRHQLGAGALFGADFRVPLAAVDDDVGDVGKGFSVVGDGRPLPDAFLNGARRLGARHTANAHNRVHQSGTFAADVGTAAGAD